MNTTLAIIVGLLIWVPTMLIVDIVRGPWFTGTEFLGAIGPILAFGLPGLIVDRKTRWMFEWVCALAPFLIWFGSFSVFMLQRAIFGNIHTNFAETFSPLLALALWCFAGCALYLFLKKHVKTANGVDT